MARSSLNAPISLPMSEASLDGATEGSKQGASDAAIKRGYTTVPDDDAGMFDRSALPGKFRDPSMNARPWLGQGEVIDDERDDNR